MANETVNAVQLAGGVLAEVALYLGAVLEAKAKVVYFAEITGLSPQLVRKQPGLPRRRRRREKALHHVQAWTRRRLEAEGLDAEEVNALLAARPEGLLQGMLYWMIGGEALHAQTIEAARRIDALDEAIGALAHARDIDAMLAWLRAGAQRGDPLFQEVDAAGCASRLRSDLEPQLELHARLGNVVVNMLLSFLALVDLEVRPRIATEQWDGRALLAALLAPAAPDSPTGAHDSVLSPIALLVDLILAAGWTVLKGELPDHRPEPLEVARLLAQHRKGGRSLDRQIHSLRREHTHLSRKALGRLVRDIKLKPSGPNQTLDEEIGWLIPLLVAAHLLSELMPRASGSVHHDRRGWREAYLRWWTVHAMARGAPHEPVGGPGPPAWITFD